MSDGFAVVAARFQRMIMLIGLLISPAPWRQRDILPPLLFERNQKALWLTGGSPVWLPLGVRDSWSNSPNPPGNYIWTPLNCFPHRVAVGAAVNKCQMQVAICRKVWVRPCLSSADLDPVLWNCSQLLRDKWDCVFVSARMSILFSPRRIKPRERGEALFSIWSGPDSCLKVMFCHLLPPPISPRLWHSRVRARGSVRVLHGDTLLSFLGFPLIWFDCCTLCPRRMSHINNKVVHFHFFQGLCRRNSSWLVWKQRQWRWNKASGRPHIMAFNPLWPRQLQNRETRLLYLWFVLSFSAQDSGIHNKQSAVFVFVQ